MSKEPFILARRLLGFDPMLSVCLICGKNQNEGKLLAAAQGGRAITFEPCDACKENYLKIGTAIYETEDESNCPTGAVLVVTDDAYKRVTRQEPPAGKSILMRREEFRKNFQHLSPKEGIAGFLHHNADGRTSDHHGDNGEEKS